MNNTFKTVMPGKWILAGEHAILRGGRAVALPRLDLSLQMEFEERSSGGFQVVPEGAMFTIQKILEILQTKVNVNELLGKLKGILKIDGNIPLGAGLGSSAAFCLAIVRILSNFVPISESEICPLATLLENQFHGKSSGIDVAAIYCAEPIGVRLVREGERAQIVPEVRRLNIKKTPFFTFHDTGVRSSTKICVNQVEELLRQDPSFGKQLDHTMDSAAEEAEKGLLKFSLGNTKEGLREIASSMLKSESCFRNWGLIPPPASELEARLLAEGALGVKLTGSGGGGIMVALWKSEMDKIL